MTHSIAITGSNGFVGSAISLQALHVGLPVRAILRRQQAIDLLSSTPAFKPHIESGALTFTLVPDLSNAYALSIALAGCTRLIHVAAPTLRPPFDNTETMVQSHVDCTLAVLRAASATSSLKRIVFTSSTYAIQTLAEATHFYDAGEPLPSIRARLAGDFSSVRKLNADDVLRVPLVRPTDHPLHYYIAGKVASRACVLDYMNSTMSESAPPNHTGTPSRPIDSSTSTPQSVRPAQQRPSFSVVLILPGCVFGPAPLARTRAELVDNSNLYMAYLFTDIKYPCYLFSEACHIDDVAEAHVRALDIHPDKTVQSFLVFAQEPHGVRHEQAAELLEMEHGDLRRRLPISGQTDTLPSYFDIGTTETELFGRPLKGLGRMAKDLALAWEALPA